MRIVKVINNNVVSSLNAKNQEIIVMGKGIGFGKRTGDELDDEQIEKIFSLPDENLNQFAQMAADMPYENIQAAECVIAYAKEQIGCRLNKNLYITLTDHLSYAVERQREGTAFSNALLWEIKKFYNQEFQVGMKAVEIIREKLDVELSEDEAGFIALHLVNAEMDGDMKDSMNMPGMIKDIFSIVKYTFQIEMDEKSLSYERFMTHLKFFVQRVVSGEDGDSKEEEFEAIIAERFPRSHSCACKIKEYMENKKKYDVSDAEVAYLAVHIHRAVHCIRK